MQHTPAVPPTRFIGLDVHKRSVMVAAVNAHQTVVFQPCRFSLAVFEYWTKQHLTVTDVVALEVYSSS